MQIRTKLVGALALLLAGCLGGATVQTTATTTATTGDGSTTDSSGSGTDSGTTGQTDTTGQGNTTGPSSTTGSTTGTSSTSTSTTTTTGTSTTGTTGLHANTPLNGLTLGLMHFAVMGDCRPANYVNNASQVAAAYPTQIITRIFSEIAGRNADFALFSGDMVYTLNPPDGSSAGAQIDLFLGARNQLDRPFAAALGNHEDTDSVDVTVFEQKLSQPLAYFGFTIHTQKGDVRFTVPDDTYWDSRQLSWVQSELSSSAPYHVVLKHYPSDSNENDESTFQQLIAQYPPTLILTGHSHTYDHPHPNELVLGTAGAPLANSAPGYGYAMIDQLSSGKLQVSVYDEGTNTLTDQWTTP